jgi:hypothetical protein
VAYRRVGKKSWNELFHIHHGPVSKLHKTLIMVDIATGNSLSLVLTEQMKVVVGLAWFHYLSSGLVPFLL